VIAKKKRKCDDIEVERVVVVAAAAEHAMRGGRAVAFILVIS